MISLILFIAAAILMIILAPLIAIGVGCFTNIGRALWRALDGFLIVSIVVLILVALCMI